MSLSNLNGNSERFKSGLLNGKNTKALAIATLVSASAMGMVEQAEAQPAFPKIVVSGANEETDTYGTVTVPRESDNVAKVNATVYDPSIECWGPKISETDRMIKYEATEEQKQAFTVEAPASTSRKQLYCAVPQGEVHVPAFLRAELGLIEDGTVTVSYDGVSSSEYIDVIGQDVREDSPSYLALHYGIGQHERAIAKLQERHATLSIGPIYEFDNKYTTEGSIGWQGALDINLDPNFTLGGVVRHVNSTLGTTYYPQRVTENIRKFQLRMPNPDVQEQRTSYMLRLTGMGEVAKGFEIGGGIELGISHAQWDDQAGLQYPNGDVEMINGVSKTSPAFGGFVGVNLYPHENILLGAELGLEGASHNRVPGSLQEGMKGYPQARLKLGVTF